MYTNKKFTSDLINSYAWDTAIVFIQEFSGDIDYSMQGRLQSILAKTGKAINAETENDVRCNIYDMAGNCYEWTTETSSYFPCVARGDGFYYSSSSYSSDRQNVSAVVAVDYYSFRPILYL